MILLEEIKAHFADQKKDLDRVVKQISEIKSKMQKMEDRIMEDDKFPLDLYLKFRTENEGRLSELTHSAESLKLKSNHDFIIEKALLISTQLSDNYLNGSTDSKKIIANFVLENGIKVQTFKIYYSK